jgi:predicted nucleic acid-binding protein/ribosomal protein S18 acetylase RimI-like enzyme
MPIIVSNLLPQDPMLGAVKELGRANKQTLGFFPDEAFEEHAVRGLVVVAVSETGELAGYTIYRITPQRSATIVHLCVQPTFRGRGVAQILMSYLDNETTHLKGIGLWCRNDFPAHRMWPRLGFIARGEKSGRSKSGSELTRWWKGNESQDLLTCVTGEERGQQLVAVMDANIFFDLVDSADTDSAGLTLGWLKEEVELTICPELFNEIARDANAKRRMACREAAQKYREVVAAGEAVEKVRTTLAQTISGKETTQNRSDLKQLAYAVAGGARAFVTRDTHLLDHADEIYEKTLVSVVRPADLVTRIDALLREAHYQRERLAGTTLTASREESIDEDLLANCFQASIDGEKKHMFLTRLRKLRADPENSGYSIIRDQEGALVGLLGYQRTDNRGTAITILRAKRGPLFDSLLRYLVTSLLLAEEVRTEVMTLTDEFSPKELDDQLGRFGFVQSASGLIKLLVPGAISSMQLAAHLRERLGKRHELDALLVKGIQLVQDYADFKNRDPLLTLERLFWPLEIRDLEIPAFIVSIRPNFAQHLFDVGIARGDMFGANIDLALNQEAVYYRSSKNSRGLVAPARLLWYVSEDSRIPGSGHIRAFSKLDEITVGPAKSTYRQFRRLGIFGYKEVLASAGGDENAHVMAMRFSGSRPLAQPFSWGEIQALFRANAINSKLLSPTKIPTELYFQIKDFKS